MKQIKQFRYYGKGDRASNNYPTWGAMDYFLTLTSTKLFKGYGSITQLGIQSRPGTKFYLNGSQYPIIIGDTGIYELNLEGLGRISSIRFDEDSLLILDEPGVTDRLLIDIIYEGSGAGV